jgi:hypothetical protein
MNDVIFVNELDTSEDLIENVDALLSGEDFAGEFALEIVQAAHVAVLHY